MRKPLSVEVIAGLLSLSQIGCLLTRELVSVATSPHPSFNRIPTVGAAALYNDELFFRLDRQIGDGQSAQLSALIVKVRLKDVDALPAPTILQDFPDWPDFPRLPIHLGKSDAMPIDAKPVQVTRLTVRRLEELEALYKTPPYDVQVFIVTLDESEGRRDSLAADQRHGGPLIVIMTPGAKSDSRVAMTRNFEQLPRLRRAWLLATPLSVAGDLVTFPLQFILLLAVGC